MAKHREIRGTSLDTRIQHSILTDSKLQAELTAEEFRAFINLMVWVVAQVSDGEFNADHAQIVHHVTGERLNRFLEVGLIDGCEDGLFRIDPTYWRWQSSLAELQRQAARREYDADRKQAKRQAEQKLASSPVQESRPAPAWAVPALDPVESEIDEDEPESDEAEIELFAAMVEKIRIEKSKGGLGADERDMSGAAT